jgi:hypothetical protein
MASSPYNVTVRASPSRISAANPVLTRLCDSQECDSTPFSILADPPTTPPYSIIVYNNLDSMPRVYPLHLERSIAYWTVVYPAGQSHPFMLTFAHQALLMRRVGTFLVCNIVDSENKPVGYAGDLKVQATNGSTACLQPRANTTDYLELSSDIGRDLDMCSPLHIRIFGGQKPYTVSLVPINVAPTINITFGENDDSLFWVNLLPPSTSFVVAASDRSVAKDL